MPSRSNVRRFSEDELDLALEAIGDFCGLRCPFFAGHARGTADLVAAASQLVQMLAPEATLARRAALVHDVGRFGVRARCGTSRGRSPTESASGCACTCTTCSASSIARNRCAGSGCSPPPITSEWTEPAITAASAGQ